MDISKIEAGKLEFSPIDVDFSNLLQGVIEICQIRAKQKATVTLIYYFDPNLPSYIHTDEKRLRQVLINLISNAVKFTDKGQVAFKVQILSKLDNREQKVLFQVEDTGIGIRAEQLEKIFLPFEQVGERQRNEEGTGLGLAISQKIIQAMGSTIQVKSEIDQGSVFWFNLCLTSLESATDLNIPPAAIIGFKGEKRKVLIVDDRWENRAVIINLLEPIGFEMLAAENGQMALDQAIATHPDLVITDLTMPIMDGSTLIQSLRQTNELKNISIISSSASVFTADQNKSLEIGANDFLPKPVQRDVLLYQLQKHLKLEWIYEQAKPEIQIEMTVPCLEELEKLAKLAAKGNLKEIIRQVERLESEDENLLLFCEKLRTLAKEFEGKEIVKLINQSIKRW